MKIRYSLLDGLDKFSINPATGIITTVTNTLDREVRTHIWDQFRNCLTQIWSPASPWGVVFDASLCRFSLR